MGNYKPFPFKIPFTRPVTKPFKRPFDVPDDVVLCLIPEIRTKWFDQSIYGNNGTITDATKVDGRFGMGLAFDAGVSNASVEIADTTELRLTSGGSICIWFYPLSLGENSMGRLLDKSWWSVFLYPGNCIKFHLSGESGEIKITSPNSITFNEWTHYVVTFDATGNHFYINGEEDTYSGGDNIRLPDNTEELLVIGNKYTKTTREFDGTIDEVEVSNKIYTAEEVKLIYDMGKPEG